MADGRSRKEELLSQNKLTRNKAGSKSSSPLPMRSSWLTSKKYRRISLAPIKGKELTPSEGGLVADKSVLAASPNEEMTMAMGRVPKACGGTEPTSRFALTDGYSVEAWDTWNSQLVN